MSDTENLTLNLEAAVSTEIETVLDALENKAPVEANEEPAVPEFTEVLAEITEDVRDQMMTALTAGFDTRAEYEKVKNGFNENIQDTIKKERAKMVRPGLAAILAAANVDPKFINREEHTGKRFNVYAFGKINDVIYGLSTGHFKNAINLAIMRSMFKFRASGLPFTGLMAEAAASDKVKVDKAMASVLVRHTVAAGTASTQKSSTMNALEVLGIVQNKGSDKFPIYELTDAPITKRVEALLAAA